MRQLEIGRICSKRYRENQPMCPCGRGKVIVRNPPMCKTCRYNSDPEYRRKSLEQHRRFYLRHADALYARTKKYRQANKERHRLYSATYRHRIKGMDGAWAGRVVYLKSTGKKLGVALRNAFRVEGVWNVEVLNVYNIRVIVPTKELLKSEWRELTAIELLRLDNTSTNEV